MWSPLEVTLLVVATGEGVAIGLLLVQCRRLTLILEAVQRDVGATLDAAERAADAAEQLHDPPLSVTSARPIGFRPP